MAKPPDRAYGRPAEDAPLRNRVLPPAAPSESQKQLQQPQERIKKKRRSGKGGGRRRSQMDFVLPHTAANWPAGSQRKKYIEEVLSSARNGDWLLQQRRKYSDDIVKYLDSDDLCERAARAVLAWDARQPGSCIEALTGGGYRFRLDQLPFRATDHPIYLQRESAARREPAGCWEVRPEEHAVGFEFVKSRPSVPQTDAAKAWQVYVTFQPIGSPRQGKLGKRMRRGVAVQRLISGGRTHPVALARRLGSPSSPQANCDEDVQGFFDLLIELGIIGDGSRPADGSGAFAGAAANQEAVESSGGTLVAGAQSRLRDLNASDDPTRHRLAQAVQRETSDGGFADQALAARAAAIAEIVGGQGLRPSPVMSKSSAALTASHAVAGSIATGCIAVEGASSEAPHSRSSAAEEAAAVASAPSSSAATWGRLHVGGRAAIATTGDYGPLMCSPRAQDSLDMGLDGEDFGSPLTRSPVRAGTVGTGGAESNGSTTPILVSDEVQQHRKSIDLVTAAAAAAAALAASGDTSIAGLEEEQSEGSL